MTEKKIYGAVAEFETAEGLLAAAKALREQGYEKLDAHTPFPIHGIDEVLGIKHSPLGWLVLGGGIAGFVAAVALQWWTGAVDYPLIIGGKPLFAFEFSIPIIFELTVLLAAFAAVGGMLALNGLPKLYHPLFNYEGFNRASDDRFLLSIEAADGKFDAERIPGVLTELGADTAAIVEEEE